MLIQSKILWESAKLPEFELTCCPSPAYIQLTTLSNKLMSNFWLKSRSFAACSDKVAAMLIGRGGINAFLWCSRPRLNLRRKMWTLVTRRLALNVHPSPFKVLCFSESQFLLSRNMRICRLSKNQWCPQGSQRKKQNKDARFSNCLLVAFPQRKPFLTFISFKKELLHSMHRTPIADDKRLRRDVGKPSLLQHTTATCTLCNLGIQSTVYQIPRKSLHQSDHEYRFYPRR